ncbi:MAG: helix-turn-helix transcriptional regulator [Opitutaceae bacterium]|nr:helix-turn-helix transcriptional regulator [Cytophagales bacterium]
MKTFFESSVGRITLILFLPFLLIFGFLVFYKSPFYFTQINPQVVNAWSFTDSLDKGNSKVIFLKKDQNGIYFSYILHPGYQYPYSGVNFVLNKDSLPNLNGFNHLKIKIKAKQGSRLPIVIGLEGGIKSKPDGKRFVEFILPVNSEWTSVEIDFDRFRSPEWWWKMNDKKEDDLPNPDFSKIRFINVQSCQIIGNEKEDLIEIESISLQVNMTWFYFASLILTVLYYAILYSFIKKKPITNIIFSYKKQESEIRSQKEKDQIIDYITSNYYQPNFGILDIQTGTGVSESKISFYIKNKTGLTFKQFLNRLRMTESKRLLKESDLQISEIAYKVGYSNVSHFNRIFKESEDCSPNDFRKK